MKKLQRRVQTEILKLDTLQKEHLTFGLSLLDKFPFRDGEHRRAVWEAHGADIIADYTQIYPGRRPTAWWQYEAKVPRQLVDGMILQDPGEWRGHHGCSAGNQGVQCNYETEPHYLRRLGLLGEDEAERLTESAFSPAVKRSRR